MEKNNNIDDLFSLDKLSQLNAQNDYGITTENLEHKLKKIISDMNNYNGLIKRKITQLKDRNIIDDNFIKQQQQYSANAQQIISYTDDIIDSLKNTEKDKFKITIAKANDIKKTLEQNNTEYEKLTIRYQINDLNEKTKNIMSSINELDKVKQQVIKSHELLDKSNDKVKSIDTDMEDLKSNVDKMLDSFQNLGFTIIGIIVSFTIVSTAIAGVVGMDKKYLPLYLSFVVWTGMTLIAFASFLFTKNSFNKESKIMYGIFTVITFAILLYTVFK